MGDSKNTLHLTIPKEKRTKADLNSLGSSLEILANEAEQFHYISEIFKVSLFSMYLMQPNGEGNYGKHPKVCRMEFSASDSYGCLDMQYYIVRGGFKDSRLMRVNLRGGIYSGFSRIIKVDFVNKCYFPLHISWGKPSNTADYLFQKDTKNIMNHLGLKMKRQ